MFVVARHRMPALRGAAEPSGQHISVPRWSVVLVCARFCHDVSNVSLRAQTDSSERPRVWHMCARCEDPPAYQAADERAVLGTRLHVVLPRLPLLEGLSAHGTLVLVGGNGPVARAELSLRRSRRSVLRSTVRRHLLPARVALLALVAVQPQNRAAGSSSARPGADALHLRVPALGTRRQQDARILLAQAPVPRLRVFVVIGRRAHTHRVEREVIIVRHGGAADTEACSRHR
jgi:hypothetical protein